MEATFITVRPATSKGHSKNTVIVGGTPVLVDHSSETEALALLRALAKEGAITSVRRLEKSAS